MPDSLLLVDKKKTKKNKKKTKKKKKKNNKTNYDMEKCKVKNLLNSTVDMIKAEDSN